MNKTIKYSLHILGWIIAGVILLLLIASLLIQTRPVKNRITKIAERQSGRFINGNLFIGKIDGNFFTNLILQDLLFTYENDTVAYIAKIDLSYNPLPLLRGKIEVPHAIIDNPYFYLEQYPDSTWNVQKLMKKNTRQKDTTEKSGTINLNIPYFEIISADFKIDAIDSVIPNRVDSLNTNLSLHWTDSGQKLELKHFSFTSQNPEFQLNELTLRIEREPDYIRLSDFYLKTARNSVDGKVLYHGAPIHKGEASMEAAQVHLEEFAYFIPDFKLSANPLVKVNGELKRDSAYIQIDLKDNNQSITVHIASANLADFLMKKTGVQLDYDVSLKLKNTELDYWLGNPELDYMINGNLELTGKGTDPKTAQFQLNGNFNKTIVKGELLREIVLKIACDNGNANTQISGQGKFGNFNIETKINNFWETPEYTAKVRTKNLDLALLTGLDSLYSNLNLTANIKGKGFDPKKLSATANIEVTNSRFQTINFDSLLVNARYQNENISANYLRFVTDSVLLVADGNYSFRANSDIQAEITFAGLGEFQQFIPVAGLSSSGKILAHFIAEGDSMYLKSSAILNESHFQDYKLQNLKVDAEARISNTDTILNADIYAGDFNTGILTVDSVNARIEGAPDSLFIIAEVQSEAINTKLETGFSPGDKLKFTVFDWQIEYKNQNWALQNPPARIEIDSMNYILENFKLMSNQSTTTQTLAAEGQISRNGEENFKLNLENIDLSRLPELLDSDFSAKGLFNLNLNVGGTSDSTVVYGDFAVNKLSYNGYRFLNFDGSLNYSDEEVKLETTIAPKDSGIFNLKAKLPVEFRMDSMNYRLNGEEPLNLALNISKFPVSILKSFNVKQNISGFAEGNITIKGTPEAPVINGKLELNQAAFNNYQFTDFWTDFSYRNKVFNVETMIVPEDSGKVNIKGTLPLQINLDTMGYTMIPEDSVDGHISIKKISLALLKAFDVSGDFKGFMEGQVDLEGTWETPEPKGNMRLINGSARIDEYGIHYSDIKLNLKILRDKIVLDTLSIRSENGNLTGAGQVDFETALYNGDISQSGIQFNFKKFNLVNHRQFNMQVNGNARVGGKTDEVVFDGDLEIPQSEIYLPAILSMMGRINTPEMPKPILIKQAELMKISLDSLGIKTFKAATPDSIQFTYFNKLEGRLRIKIPKNTWIKNEDMRIEISGDLELIKNKEFFELFGSVEVVRGQYDLLGKTFIIDEGTISFQGGEEILPQLNIKASYKFRKRGSASQNLTVQITGTPESPEVNFMLDGSTVSEGDALSYILFGKAMNELTISEQQNVEGASGGSLAREAAASVLSSQISNFLGDKLNVDYIEVKGDGSFDNASVVVGKYITKDLFVSYEQRFGETDEKDIAKYEVTLEYELFRFLFFELNNSSNDSGFDVIIKFDAE